MGKNKEEKDVALRAISLFAGVGGLDLGLGLATGARTVCYVEREAYAAATLVARMEDSGLGQAPIWDDVTTFDATAWRGAVDIVIGGFPCQDLSTAGVQRGLEEGKRSSLWSEMLRIANESGARLIFAENVDAIRNADGRNVDVDTDEPFRERALGTVLRDLAESGWDAEWLCLRASDVGAPHRRERWFMLAYRDSFKPITNSRQPNTGANWRNDAPGGSGELADTENIGHQRGRNSWGGRFGFEDSGGVTLANPRNRQLPEQGRRSKGRDGAGPAGAFPPGPDDGDRWARIIADSPHLAPAVEPGLRVLADGVAMVVDTSRTDQLRCCGNGVVPLQAAVAFRELAARVGIFRNIDNI